MSKARLDLKELVVTSFATASTSATATPVTAMSEEAGCMSPLCMPTYWQGCEPTVAGA
ncbi:MAG TPA: hypothetical protein VE913_23990 [Longimicrobium sp.]|nr:hypothetical protein [Longimicrobium sp.]